MTKFFQAEDDPFTYELSQTKQDAIEAVQNVGPQASTQWRQAVSTAKQCVLDQRNRALNLSDSNETSDDPKRAGVRTSANSRARKAREGNVVVTSIDSLPECERAQLETAGSVIKPADKELMNQVSDKFSLNVDQKRAYKLVVSALLTDIQPATRPQSQQLIDNDIDFGQFAAFAPPTKDPLRMYLGGIGGTGKSQVVNGILLFLERKNESYKCLVLAPTGSAASLVDGSTYHSTLSLSIDSEDSATQTRITSIASKFKSVRLIIVHEVSMLLCKDLYTISHQLESAFKQVGTMFGGLHVLLAGDFGQLPPVGWSCSLYSSHASLSSLAVSVKGQKDVMGWSLWHTFTTVVILRINMRQRGESEGDSGYRTALGNMRYGKCTDADIKLLNSRVLGSPSAPTLSDPRFRNVSVITAWNFDRDAINSVSCERFALESGQKLV
ncbi:hypothetical protein NLI96_g13171 [Meripilus lineatus]|uniref:ATP-dependent DNA helicase n=1 Tax=Meripilus lineatus TaxID=2056292 RepID=A0AAD5Y970_9APHY|nr:hypothetical protein NLI96_g13171 [Physisporinus lineatus]